MRNTRTANAMLDPSNAKNILNGDQLINLNSFDYLQKIADTIPHELRKTDNSFNEVAIECHSKARYKLETAYGNLYTKFLLELESTVEPFIKQRNQAVAQIKKLEKEIATDSTAGRLKDNSKKFEAIQTAIDSRKDAEKKINAMGDMFKLVYANDNQALERTAAMIEGITEKVPHTSKKIESEITKLLKRKDAIATNVEPDINTMPHNNITPEKTGSRWGLLLSNFTWTFKPQTTTSMVSIRSYKHQKPGVSPTEYRMGTQGQIQNFIARVSPLFEAMLRVKALNPSKNIEKDGPIQHLYINNLTRDPPFYHPIKRREARLTKALHELENRHDNVAVITLPADGGMMSHKWATDRNQTISYESAKAQMLAIATGESKGNNFHISDKVKKLLYGQKEDKVDIENEKIVLEKLLNESFKRLGFEGKQLSKADMQAVYVDFINYTFTNFIINEKLKPESFNMSCKDGIDRGGVSSAYYNLMKSIEKGGEFTMSKEEFTRALHAAPTMIKGRGMNNHSHRIWNTVDAYINGQDKAAIIEAHKFGARAQAKEVSSGSVPTWLREWRNNNSPPVYAHEGIIKRAINRIKSLLSITSAAPAYTKLQEKTHETSADINNKFRMQPRTIKDAYIEKIEQLKNQLVEIQNKLSELEEMINEPSQNPETHQTKLKTKLNEIETLYTEHFNTEQELTTVTEEHAPTSDEKETLVNVIERLDAAKKKIEPAIINSSDNTAKKEQTNVNVPEKEGDDREGTGTAPTSTK